MQVRRSWNIATPFFIRAACEHVFVHRSYRYRLYPTRRQCEALDAHLRAACDLYNAALEQRRWLWREHGVSIGYGGQSAELRTLRAEGLLPAGANFWSQQEVLRRLDRAFSAFHRRVRTGESPGHPRFKSARRFSTLAWSFAGNAGGVAIRDGRLYLQGIGSVKVKWHRAIPSEAKLSELRVTRKRGARHGWRYYATFQIELPDVKLRHHPGVAVGLDVGIRIFARLSTGESIGGPRAGREGATTLRRLGRAHARTRKGSRRRAKAAARIARNREREANRRRDAAHKASRELVERFGLIAVEDLNLRGMLRSAAGTPGCPGRGVAAKSALNREIADQGWGQFLAMLAYKAEEAGGRVERVDPRGSSQTCAECRASDPRNRRDAVFRCVACGHRADADTNAARVLLARALLQLQGPGRGLQARTPAVAGLA
jgi:putative transposase